MLLFFILFLFFILHIQFLLKNLFFGVDESQFFDFIIIYPFNHYVALESLIFTLVCAGSFVFFYTLVYRTRKSVPNEVEVDLRGCRRELLLLNVMGMVMVSYILVVGEATGFNYGQMTEVREKYGFIFELRMIFLLLLSHLLFNVQWKQFLSRPELKSVRWVTGLYFIVLILFQARSALFELAIVIIFPLLMWTGEKIKFKYVLFVVISLIVPNLIVLGRLEVDNPYELINYLFSIEYDITINKFLGAAIETGYSAKEGLSFLPQLSLIIPSPLRSLLEMDAISIDYMTGLSQIAGVYGGGFSLLAQMYSDFGWFSPLVYGVFGLLIGRANFLATQVGRVTLVHATAPLLYVAFLLAFRNDLGIFLKYIVQLVMVAFLLSLVLKNRLGKG